MEGLGNIGNITDLPSARAISDGDMNAYGGDSAELMGVWGILIFFTAVFYVLSVFALKMTTKRIKK